ncbi:MAG: DUF547 domain-containing protein [Anaerolineae bacterium]|nr:DUF547 domain-containing protein [Anaerolineae bacterium]
MMKHKQTLPQKLLRRLYHVPLEVLNMHPQVSPEPEVMSDLGQRLHAAVKDLKQHAVDPVTGQVAYAQVAQSALYQGYRTLTGQLANLNLDTLGDEQAQRAFWINIYNALTIDAIIALGVRESVQEVPQFWMRAAYHMGGYRFSLDDIEHGILRGNAGHPFIPGRQFGPDDPRLRWVLPLDFRIHFALVCGADSCPPIRVYDPDKLDAQLHLALFWLNIHVTSIQSPSHGQVRLPRLLMWYSGDFGAHLGLRFGLGKSLVLLRAIAPFIQDARKRDWLLGLQAPVPVQFAPYNWSLNGA